MPYNDESESDDEDGYALDEVSSDVEMNPEDMLDLPSDEDEEDEGYVFPIMRSSPTMSRVDIFQTDVLKRLTLIAKQKQRNQRSVRESLTRQNMNKSPAIRPQRRRPRSSRPRMVLLSLRLLPPKPVLKKRARKRTKKEKKVLNSKRAALKMRKATPNKSRAIKAAYATSPTA